MQKRALSGPQLLLPVLLVVGIIGIAPFVSGVYNSFYHDYFGERSFAGFDNYRFLFSDKNFLYSLRITMLWASLNTILSLFAAYTFALRLVSSKWFSRPLYLALLIPWGIPVYIAVPLWRALLHGNGGYSLFTFLFNLEINLISDPVAAFCATLAVSLWMTVPLTTFVFVGALRKIPSAILEAARLDGACENEISLNIYLPRISEILLVMGVLNFVKSLKEFTVVFLMTAGGPPLKSGITASRITGATSTLEILLYEVFSETTDFGIPASYSVIILALVVFLILLWIIIKQGGGKSWLLILFSAAAQPAFNGPGGFLFTAIYLMPLAGWWAFRNKKTGNVFRLKTLFSLSFLVHLVINILRMAQAGFIRSFDCGLLIALLCLCLVFSRDKAEGALRVIRVPHLPDRLLTGLSYIMSGVTMIFTFLILYLLFWMSISAANVCFIETLLPPFRTFSKYLEIFTRENIQSYFLNTLFISSATGLLIPLLVLPGAAYLSEKKGAFPDFFLSLIKGIGLMTGIHSLIPLFALFNSLGLLNSYLPLVLIYLFHSLAFALFTVKTYLDQLPRSFRENALLEGMGSRSYLLRILLPVSLPVLVTAVMVSFLSAWNGFLAPLLFLNDDTRYTISIKLYTFVGSLASGNPQWNLFAASSVINLLFIVVIFLLLKKLVYFSPLHHYEDQD